MLQPAEHSLEILHVEDNDGDAVLVQVALKEVLPRDGYHFERARNLAEAVNLLRHGVFDAVLLDMDLGDTQGISTVRRVREEVPDLPIIVLSGNDDMQLALQSVHEGAQEFIIKGSSDRRGMALSLLSSILRKSKESQLHRIANSDALTGLPNRSRFISHLTQVLLHCERWQRSHAIMFLDVNGFKSVNDTYGHEAGDTLLKHISSRLRKGLRACDLLARYAGDEFVVHLDCEDSVMVDDCVRVAEKINALFEQPVVMGDIEIQTGVSIGIALYPECGRDVDTLIRQADMAMYVAKRERRAYAFAGPASLDPFTA